MNISLKKPCVILVACLIVFVSSACLPDFDDRFKTYIVKFDIGQRTFLIPRNYLKSNESLTLVLSLPDFSPFTHSNKDIIDEPETSLRVIVSDSANPEYKPSKEIMANHQIQQKRRLEILLKNRRGETEETIDAQKGYTKYSYKDKRVGNPPNNGDVYIYRKGKPDEFILACSTYKEPRAYCRYDGTIFGDLRLYYSYPITSQNDAINIHKTILALLARFNKENPNIVPVVSR